MSLDDTQYQDLTEHETYCDLIGVTCADCKLAYQRCELAEQHSDLIYLGEYLRPARHESQEKTDLSDTQFLVTQIMSARSKRYDKKIVSFALSSARTNDIERQ